LFIFFSIFGRYLRKKYSYWSSRGIPSPPTLPFLGNFVTRALTPSDKYQLDLVRKYGKIYGVYNGTKQVLNVADPEAIKQMMIKDFHLFVNRRQLSVYHEIFNLNLFNLEGDDWKRVRSITTPAFTTGK